MSSLKSRLNFGVFLISLIFFGFLMIINIIFFNSFGQDFLESRLQNDTDALLANLNPDENGRLTFDEDNVNPIFLQPFSGHYFRVDLENQSYLSRSLWDRTMAGTSLNLGESKINEFEGPIEEKLLVLEGAYEKEGQLVRIVVAEDFSPITDSLKTLTIALVILNGGIVLLLMFIQRFIVTRGMGPLQKTTEELSAIGAGEKDFLDEKVPEEVLPLVKEINQLMIMVDNRIKRSTTALGNLAHALKTPLALIEQSASGNIEEKSAKEIKGATNQIKRQLDSELKRARIIGSTAHGHKIDLKNLIGPLIETLKKIYQEKNINFTVSVDEKSIYVGDRHDMMELFGNLLDNACKWTDSKIEVSIRKTEKLEIFIEDDGPGISKEKIREIETRGHRLDEAGEGHGLGLSIVREIIDLNNAQITYGRSEKWGGLKVSIRIGTS